MREYYAYKFQIRKEYSPNILNAGRLLQQFAVDMYVKLETQRLDFYRSKQLLIQREQLQGLMDSVIQGQSQGSKVGQRVLLPASFIGGPRDMKKRYMNAMALVQKFGRPDLFLTMTCNPSWPEIKENMLPTDETQNRIDLCARVFQAKLEMLKEELFKKEIFGQVAAYTYVIEFQKRGLPHAHFLIILKPNSKLYSLDSYDQIVSAELPDEGTHKHLFKMVRKHMMHGPCGSKNPNNVCMQGKKVRFCKNKYPKQWADSTTHGQNAYPIYRRRNDGKIVHVRGQELDNRWVVPHNPYLLAKFNCHINVEICSTIKVVKYMFKYIFKGHDKIHFRVNSDTSEQCIDEIKEYQTARWVSGIEAMWRIYRFTLNEMHPSVMNLQLHLQNYQSMSFKDNEDIRDLLKNQFKKRTMLTEFFYMNATDDLAKALKCTYKEFPQHFVWHPDKKYWSARKQKDCIGRIVAANPNEGERYFLRLLLINVKGPTSFDDLKMIDNKYANSLQEAAILRGYFESNNAQQQCLEEAALYHMPHTFRRLFATILVHFPPANPRQLWENFEESLSEDFYHQPHLQSDQIQLNVLHEISKFLQSMGKNSNSYDLVPRILRLNPADRETRDTMSETQIIISDEDIASISRLNMEQKLAFDIITAHVYNNHKGSFFLDGPGGTGKTFLYKALLADIRSRGFIALATASSEVAASILPGGRTAHSRFKIPINMDTSNMCTDRAVIWHVLHCHLVLILAIHGAKKGDFTHI
ncbi:uncharacterized protein LOC113769103 [Coffea eugenioides]|uniref:uncharacterized protein LOC113769103 n=1 Tax=Coffea eugenioides TaxID=49369 RepID=UPI000F6132ED|nr:uncharacterized protein LOC113769103 [Coffea eugenioides]